MPTQNNRFAGKGRMAAPLAAALATLMVAPLAMADVQVYGRAHVTVDSLSDGSNSALNVSSNSSRLGFRANTGVADGLTAIMQIEQEVRYENGAGNFASRDTFVGLRGEFGQVRLGFFDTPLKRLRGSVDLFGDQIGDARNMTRLRDNYSGADYDFETRFRNSIHYRSPTFNDVTFDFQYSTNTDSAATTDGDNDAISTALTWDTGDTMLATAYERKNDSGSDSLRFAFGQTLGDLRVVGMMQFATIKGSTLGADQDVDTYGLGASYRLSGDTTLKGQYYWVSADGTDRDANMLAVGVDHRLSSSFRLLAAYARTSNDANVRYSMSAGGHGAQVYGAPGQNPYGFSVGFRYDF